MYGDPGTESTAALEARGMLHGLVHRMAEAGRLGVVLTLIGMKPEDRGPALSEAILAAVTTDGSDKQTTRGSVPQIGPWE